MLTQRQQDVFDFIVNYIPEEQTDQPAEQTTE